MGKTHLAIALGKRLCQEGHATLFLPVNFLFEEIQAVKAAGRYLQYVRSLIKAKVLILDDLGLRTYSHEEATALMDILEERYQKAPVIVTSQVDPEVAQALRGSGHRRSDCRPPHPPLSETHAERRPILSGAD